MPRIVFSFFFIICPHAFYSQFTYFTFSIKVFHLSKMIEILPPLSYHQILDMLTTPKVSISEVPPLLICFHPKFLLNCCHQIILQKFATNSFSLTKNLIKASPIWHLYQNLDRSKNAICTAVSGKSK